MAEYKRAMFQDEETPDAAADGSTSPDGVEVGRTRPPRAGTRRADDLRVAPGCEAPSIRVASQRSRPGGCLATRL